MIPSQIQHYSRRFGKPGNGLPFTTPFVLSPADGEFSIYVWIKEGAPGQTIISQADGTGWLSADPSEGNLMTELCINTLHRCGRARSSVEAAVMTAERRGSVIQLPMIDQLFMTEEVIESRNYKI